MRYKTNNYVVVISSTRSLLTQQPFLHWISMHYPISYVYLNDASVQRKEESPKQSEQQLQQQQ